MKKKLLSLAVVSAIGTAGIAQAVHVNPDGLGQVLIYPFYTVEGGGDTYVSVTNTTSVGKAVKVRFLEAMNSQEVLDFNLYLSPHDMWTGVITDDPNADGAIIRTTDNSCTVPAIPENGQAFRRFQYQADSVNGIERTREGYIEMIEMGEVVDNPALGWITHDSTGVPSNCAAVRARWNGGDWVTNPTVDLGVPGGGLYGFGVLINVGEGTDGTYDAIALDDFSGSIIHTNPESILPNLNSANPRIADIISGNQVIEAFFDQGVDAVSTLFMHDTVANDYVLAPEIAAGTDWVVNFPTKVFYTNLGSGPQFGFEPPFTAGWNRDTSRACEPFSITLFDREEASRAGELDFSPLPPELVDALCWEANVVTFNESDVLMSQRVRTNLPVEFENGWARFDFTGVPGRELVDLDGTVFRGLPVVGFGLQKYVNGDVGGLLSNYVGLANHKGTRDIIVSD